MGLWRCENCGDGTPPFGGGPEWRWAGDRMQHKCSGLDPQAGHFDCRWFGNGNGHPANYCRDSSAMLAAIAADPDDDTRRLAYADWLDERDDHDDHDRAELIRIQHAIHTGNTYRADALQIRERELIDAHPEWTQWPCLYCDGTSCGWSGYLLKDRRITWDRGWPGWVHVERVSDLVTEPQQRPCGWCHGTGQERIADAAGDMDYATCHECGGESDVMREYPTPLLSALAETPPWGVPLRGVIVEELRPSVDRHGLWWFRDVNLLSAVFNCLPDRPMVHTHNGADYPTEQAAIRAAAAAFLEFGRKHK